jgi:hypothetical protein
MAKKLSKGGLNLVAGGPGIRPMVWRVTDRELSRTYTFTPGVATFVEPEDLAWFQDPDNLGGRVFEVVPPEGESPSAAGTAKATTKDAGKGAAGGDADAAEAAAKKHDTSTPEAAFAAVGDVVDRFTEVAGKGRGTTPPVKPD